MFKAQQVGGVGGTSDIVKKAYDLAPLEVVSSTTFVDVEGISFEATSGTYYDVELMFFTQTDGTSQNHKFRWDGAGLAARTGLVFAVQSFDSNSDTYPVLYMRPFDATGTIGRMITANDRNYAVSYRMLMQAGSTGTAQFQFAQDSSDVNASIIDTVYLRVREVTF